MLCLVFPFPLIGPASGSMQVQRNKKGPAQDCAGPRGAQLKPLFHWRLVAGRTRAGQQNLVDHVDHTVVCFDIGNDHVGHFTGAIGNRHAAIR